MSRIHEAMRPQEYEDISDHLIGKQLDLLTDMLTKTSKVLLHLAESVRSLQSDMQQVERDMIRRTDSILDRVEKLERDLR